MGPDRLLGWGGGVGNTPRENGYRMHVRVAPPAEQPLPHRRQPTPRGGCSQDSGEGMAGSDWRKPTARRVTVDAGCPSPEQLVLVEVAA